MIEARDLAIEVASRPVLAGAGLQVRAGDKAGLVGRNGAGKTSLLRVLAGEAAPANGFVQRRGALGYVPQDPSPRASGPEPTALSHLLSGRGLDRAAARLAALQKELERDSSEAAIARFSEAEEAFRQAGGYSAESEARRIAAGLGLAEGRLELPLAALSGGEKRRLELGRVLFAQSEVLLLDEPTNHLDREAKAWLMDFLRGYRGALVVVSHDLQLLDSAITRVLHLDRGTLVEYRGTYSRYLEARRQEAARLGRLAERQQSEIRRLTALADIMRRQTAKRARTAHALDKRVERLRAVAVASPRRERRLKLRLPPPPHSGRMVLRAEGLAKAYDGGPPVFREVSFELRRSERLLVMGLNGAGKTSLLRVLAQASAPSQGSFQLGASVCPGYYAQEHEGISAGRSVLVHMREQSDATEPELRAVLGTFGLTGDVARQDAGSLSGGEKTKLALAQLVAGRRNLLLLDEPTNNLDPPSRTAVARALAAWPGTMIVVSHDRDFVAELEPDRVLLMPEGRLDFWDDDLLELVAMA